MFSVRLTSLNFNTMSSFLRDCILAKALQPLWKLMEGKWSFNTIGSLLLLLRLPYKYKFNCIRMMDGKGRHQREKNVFFRALPESPKPTPPMTPIRATWSSFFGSRNSRFESQFRTKNTICTISWLPYSTYLYLDFHLLSRRWLLHGASSVHMTKHL